MTKQEMFLAAKTMIDAKLMRVRDYLIRTYIWNGRLDEDHQWAVRIIDSRLRILERLKLTHLLPENNEIRMKAEIELGLDSDVGELVRWFCNNHAIGRLDCGGCCYGSRVVNGIPVKEFLTRLCQNCKNGLQHVIVVEKNEAWRAIVGFREARRMVGQAGGLEKAQGVFMGDSGASYLLYVCEECGNWDIERAG